MYPKPIQQLIEYFTRLPGIGPRAAGRFVFALLKEDPELVKDFGETLASLPQTVIACGECFRAVEKNPPTDKICDLCQNNQRNQAMLMVVEKDSDFLNIEKNRFYNGLYHVLGGTISALDTESTKKLKIKELYDRVRAKKSALPQLEIILATNPTPEGDNTANYLEKILEPLIVKITRLGRGITAGSELEYLDETTMRNALKNRK